MISGPTLKQTIQFILQLKKNCKIDVQFLKGKSVVLIIGPTGSGKSSFINMMARSKFTCIMNLSEQWEITAVPQVAKIGHTISQTFLPNYWQDQTTKIIYCDCPGFKDNRGYIYDISKSYFIEQIGTNVKDFKIVTIGDISTLKSVRGGSFKQSVEEINTLIPNFKFERDCILIATKVGQKTKPQVIHHLLKQKMGYSFPLNKIFLIRQPNDDGIIEYLDKEITDHAPSLKQDCQLPLSSLNRLKIQQYLTVVQKQIAQKIVKFGKLLSNCLLSLCQNNVQSPQTKINQYQAEYPRLFDELKKSTSIQTFDIKINQICIKLNSQRCIKLSQCIKKMAEYINQMVEHQAFLNRLLRKKSSFQELLQKLNPLLTKKQKKKGQNISLINQKILTDHLKGMGIQINNIKNTVHIKLTADPPAIQVFCQGLTKYTGSKKYQGEAPYSGTIPYSGQVNYQVQKNYSGEISYNEDIPYSGSVITSTCSHKCDGKWHYRMYKIFHDNQCSSQSKHINFQGTKHFSGSIPYHGNVSDKGIKQYSGYIGYKGKQKYKGQIQYSGQVKYSKSQYVNCKDSHHKCQCNNLALLCINIIKIWESIQYFKQIITEQNQKLRSFSIAFRQINVKAETDSTLTQLIKSRSLNQSQIQKQLHFKLTQTKGTFIFNTSGKVPYSGQKHYSGSINYSGEQPYNGQVKINGHIPYKGKQSKKLNETVSHDVKCYSCYYDCWVCNLNISTFYKTGTAEISKTITKDYNGYEAFQITKAYSGKQKYTGSVDYQSVCSYTGQADYKHQKTVTCQKDHHNCQSCTKWENYTNLLKLLYQDQINIKNLIIQNGIKIEDAFFKQYL